LLTSFEQARNCGDLRATVRLSLGLSQLATNQWTWAFDRGYARLRLGEFRGAISDFTEAVAAEPQASICLLGRYLARSALNDSEAVADLRAAMERVPALSAAPSQEATVADPSLVEQWDTIAGDCSADLRANPLATYLFCARGVAEAANGTYHVARVDLNQACKLQPSQEEPCLAIALIWRKVALRSPFCWTNASQAASRALALKPDDPLAKSLLAEATQHLKQPK
jgi:regulator of sirC expression with transglutaminase-like and TPR domain